MAIALGNELASLNIAWCWIEVRLEQIWREEGGAQGEAGGSQRLHAGKSGPMHPTLPWVTLLKTRHCKLNGEPSCQYASLRSDKLSSGAL
jgi:hypothetical protein